MEGDQPTWHVEVVEETGSTNTDLLAAGRAGAPDRTVLRARHQTAGRGRLDRRWEAPPDTNLLVSILFRHGLAHPHRATQRVALAAVRACERVAGVRPDLKWPNDVELDGCKLGGILAQAGGEAGRVDFVVVGLGLNVGWAPEGAARLGDGIDPAGVLEALLVALSELEVLPDAEVAAEYRRRLGTLGQVVRVTVGAGGSGGELVGEAVDVLEDGRLVVRPAGGGPPVCVDTGDVVQLRRLRD